MARITTPHQVRWEDLPDGLEPQLAQGTAAQQPTAAQFGVGYWYSTDTGVKSHSDGTSWTQVGLGFPAGNTTVLPVSNINETGLTTVTATTYTELTTDNVIEGNAASNAINITLLAPTKGNEIIIKKTDSTANVVTITPNGGTIDGYSTFGLADQYQWVQLWADGTNWLIKAESPLLSSALTTGTSALTAADTLILSRLIPANLMRAGTSFRIRVHGNYAGSVSQVASFRARIGTAGTTADAAMVTVATAAGGTTTVGFTVEIIITVRTTGSGGTAMANGHSLGIPANAMSITSNASTGAVNTTVANFVSLTAGVAAITANLTIQNCTIEVVKL